MQSSFITNIKNIFPSVYNNLLTKLQWFIYYILYVTIIIQVKHTKLSKMWQQALSKLTESIGITSKTDLSRTFQLHTLQVYDLSNIFLSKYSSALSRCHVAIKYLSNIGSIHPVHARWPDTFLYTLFAKLCHPLVRWSQE